jgi:hypothetical protein
MKILWLSRLVFFIPSVFSFGWFMCSLNNIWSSHFKSNSTKFFFYRILDGHRYKVKGLERNKGQTRYSIATPSKSQYTSELTGKYPAEQECSCLLKKNILLLSTLLLSPWQCQPAGNISKDRDLSGFVFGLQCLEQCCLWKVLNKYLREELANNQTGQVQRCATPDHPLTASSSFPMYLSLLLIVIQSVTIDKQKFTYLFCASIVHIFADNFSKTQQCKPTELRSAWFPKLCHKHYVLQRLNKKGRRSTSWQTGINNQPVT